MALKILYQRVNGTLTQNVSAAATLLPVDTDTLSLLQAQVNFSGGDWTYLTFADDIYSEEVKVLGISGTALQVIRAQSGSTARAFASNATTIYDHVGAAAITDIIAANPAPSALTFAGNGLASAVLDGTQVTVTVAPPNFVGTDGIVVTGNWPNLTFSDENQGEGGCGCGGGGGEGGDGVNQVQVTSAILQANIDGTVLHLILPSPAFIGQGGVTVSGSWFEGYTISGAGGGGTGTVVNVGNGTGLGVSGSPNTNPTLFIANTGVAAGTYGGFTFNAQGQLTSVSSGYNPISTIVLTNGGDSTVSGTGYTITLHEADVGVKGIVALADSAAPLNAADDATAVTPKLLAASIANLGAQLFYGGSSTGETDGSYTNILSATAQNLVLGASDKAIIICECEVVGADPTVAANYGLGVFSADNVKLYSSRKIKQNKQTAIFAISGAYNKTISLVTTTLDSGDAVSTSFLAAIVF